MEAALPLSLYGVGSLLGALRQSLLASLAVSLVIGDCFFGPLSSSGSPDNPFHTIVTAAEVSVLVILRQRARHVLAVQLVKHAQIIVGFGVVGFQRDGLLVLLFRLFELVHAGINHTEIHVRLSILGPIPDDFEKLPFRLAGFVLAA